MNIVKKSSLASFALLAVASFSSVQADHNSVWGEGWAQMPNDIHNTRLDTDDNDDFIDFVSQGSGSESVNRFLVDDTAVASAGGSAAGGMGGQQSGRTR